MRKAVYDIGSHQKHVRDDGPVEVEEDFAEEDEDVGRNDGGVDEEHRQEDEGGGEHEADAADERVDAPDAVPPRLGAQRP